MSKISELSDGGSLVSTDFLIAVRSGGNVKVKMDTINVDQVDLGDNEFIRLGNSQDLTMVHTSTQSIINQAGIGDLLLQKAGATKLTINASGIDVTGSVTADGLVTQATANTYPASAAQIKSLAGDISYITNVGGSFLISNSSTTDQFALTSAGNVGIGTSSSFFTAAGRTSLSVNGTSSSILAFGKGGSSENYILADAGGLTIANTSATLPTAFFNNGSTRMTIDASGNVGIGVVPSAWHASWKALQIGPIGFVGSYQAGTTDITALGSNVYSDGAYKYIETDEAVIYKQQNGTHIFDVAPSGTANAAISWTTAMTIDNSGNLLVGKSALDFATAGTEIMDHGEIQVTRESGVPMYLRRNSSDGDILSFYKDGTNVGSIGNNGDNLGIESVDVGLLFVSGSSQIIPTGGNFGVSDGTKDLGRSNTRFKDLFLSNNISLSNASTSAFVQVSSDVLQFGTSSNDPVVFYANNADRMRISADGEVTQPYQPAFSVTVNAAQNNIATDTDVVVVFGAETFDVGANFTGNEFTAPVTGKYQLDLILRLDNIDTAANYYIISFFTSNRQYRFIYDPSGFTADLGYWSTSLGILADMDTNDTVYVTINQSGGSAQTDVVNATSYQRFTGYLVA